MSAPLLFPVGHLLGASYPRAGSPEHVVQVRVGPELVDLDDTSFSLWALAHGLPGHGPEDPWTREAVEQAAQAQGLTDAAALLDALLTDRLLVEVAVEPAPAVAFAEQHRLLPLVEGLGNDPDAPQLWSVGPPGQPLVTVTAAAFDLFEWAHMDTDLWAACQAAARSARGVGRTDPVSTEPELLLLALVESLHQLTTPGVVCLDTRLAAS
ncbi:hypothetical protein [Modestobacter sp. Leaf380]|uniref:hypothetical protein n=1 Tax=Modestobacter sp. Leaf380 TaxID=1736356 RepID=UPI000701B8AD|nr:hypothetical protein [Modestobacter sp. Leaf380]KQS73727.1 hypothetical protein ASG41_03815 [Modestobacter sp. Leaf380]